MNETRNASLADLLNHISRFWSIGLVVRRSRVPHLELLIIYGVRTGGKLVLDGEIVLALAVTALYELGAFITAAVTDVTFFISPSSSMFRLRARHSFTRASSNYGAYSILEEPSRAARATVVVSRGQLFVLRQGRATRARGGRGEQRKGQEEELTLFLEAPDRAKRVSEPDRVLPSMLLSVQMKQS